MEEVIEIKSTIKEEGKLSGLGEVLFEIGQKGIT
jgi:hypothetical protein